MAFLRLHQPVLGFSLRCAAQTACPSHIVQRVQVCELHAFWTVWERSLITNRTAVEPAQNVLRSAHLPSECGSSADSPADSSAGSSADSPTESLADSAESKAVGLLRRASWWRTSRQTGLPVIAAKRAGE